MTEETLTQIELFFENAPAWNGGSEHAWEGMALMDAEFYSALVDLIYQYVPPERLQTFTEEWK